MSIVNGWVTWAERRDGHPEKVYTQRNSGEGIACHSIVGDLPNHTIPWRFLSDERVPGTRQFTRNAAASVMFIVYRDGHLTQMYPVTASTWTSDGFDGNTRYWAIEAEGGGVADTREPLTGAASDTFVRLVTEWERHTGRTAVPNANILQHKQIASLYGYAPTACASDRYAGAWARISNGERYEGGTMTDDEIRKLVDTAIAAQFRALLNLAVNGGPGAFTDPQGNPLPLVRDNDLVARVAALEHPKPRVITISGATLTGDLQ